MSTSSNATTQNNNPLPPPTPQKWPARSILHAHDASGSPSKRIRPPPEDSGGSWEAPPPPPPSAAASKGTIHHVEAAPHEHRKFAASSLALPRLNLDDVLPKTSARINPRLLSVPHPPSEGHRWDQIAPRRCNHAAFRGECFWVLFAVWYRGRSVGKHIVLRCAALLRGGGDEDGDDSR